MPAEAARIIVDIDSDSRRAESDLKRVDRSLKKVDRSTKQLDKDTQKYGRNAKRSFATARTAYLGYAAAIGVGIAAFRAILNATRVQVEANTRLRAVLRSTGEAAGLTYNELKNMASGLQAVTTFGDEAINNAQSLLLTFTSIGRDVFPDALESILNVSTAMGQDLQQSVQQVGRALNDPIKGVAALTRVGVQFTDQQKAQIRTMQQAGDIAGAQRVILGELETQFGGLARAMADTPFGKWEQFKNTIGDIAEEIGEEMVPGLANLAESMNTAADDTNVLRAALRGVGSIVSEAASQIADLINQLNALGDLDFYRLAQSSTIQRQVTQARLAAGRAKKERLAAKEGRTAPTFPGPTTPQPSGGGGGGAGPRGRTDEQLRADEERFRQEQRRAEEEDLRRFKDIQVAKVEAERAANEERIALAKETFNVISGLVGSAISGLGEIYKNIESNEIQRAENVYGKRLALIENNVADETERARLIEQVEAQKEARLKAIQKQAAERQKKLAIAETIINTAKGALAAFASAQSLPYPANLIAGAAGAAIVTALGAAKLATISSAPPAAQFGGDFVVPPGNEADSGLINVNQGERVSVEPVRKSDNEMPDKMILSVGGVEFEAYLTNKIQTILNSGSVQVNRKQFVKEAS